MIERLPTGIPLAIDAHWQTRFWTTNPPIYIPHTEWALAVTVTAVVPFRLARLDLSPTGTTVSKYDRRESLDRDGSRYEVAGMGATEIEPARALLDSPWRALKTDAPKCPVSWEVIPVLRDALGAARVAIIAFPRQDTDGLRAGQWRVREGLRQFLPVQSEAFNRGIRVASGIRSRS